MSAILQEGRFLALVVAALWLSGCAEKPTVSSYDVPKEYAEAALFWKTPEGWVQDPDAPSPKVASFMISGENGLMGKVGAMPFGGEVSMVEVANMFSRELGLPPLSEGTLAEMSEKKKLGDLEFEIATLGDPDANGTDSQRTATLALLPGERETWLLMMIAEAALAKEQRPKFEQFLGSLTVLASKEEPKEDALNRFLNPPVAAGSPPPFSPPAAPTFETPDWEVPEDWKEQPASAPRIATFSVTGEGGTALDVSVTRFPGSMGGPLANLNRWRRQIGLDAIPADQLAEHATEREVGGRPSHLVHLKNGDQGMLALMTLSETGSWFVKATGPAGLVESQKPSFEAFIDSIRFPTP